MVLVKISERAENCLRDAKYSQSWLASEIKFLNVTIKLSNIGPDKHLDEGHLEILR